MTPAIQTLFNRLSDGLAIVSDDRKVRFANEVMRRMLPLQVGQTFPHLVVADLLEQAHAEHLSLPHSFQTELAHDPSIAGPDRLSGHIVRSPAGRDLVVVLRNMTEASIYEIAIENFSSLIDRALLAPLQDFTSDFDALLDALAQPGTELAPLEHQRASLAVRGKQLVQQLQELAHIALISRGRTVVGEDRIELETWLAALLRRQQARAQVRYQQLTMMNANRSQSPVIYGSVHWLGVAVDACISNAIEHSAPGTEITLETSVSAAFVRIILRNRGRGFQSELARSRLMRPLIRGQEAQDSTPGLGLGLPLARSIVEMHQGRLVLDQELDGFVTCTVELPTAISPQAPDELNLALAQRYANDLARLMTTRRSKPQRNTQ